MKTEYLTPTWRWALAALLLLILIALAVNWTLLLQVNQVVVRMADDGAHADRLPCGALPTRFLLDSPECAQRLLQAMNVSNVRVVSHAAGTTPEIERRIHAEYTPGDGER